MNREFVNLAVNQAENRARESSTISLSNGNMKKWRLDFLLPEMNSGKMAASLQSRFIMLPFVRKGEAHAPSRHGPHARKRAGSKKLTFHVASMALR